MILRPKLSNPARLNERSGDFSSLMTAPLPNLAPSLWFLVLDQLRTYGAEKVPMWALLVGELGTIRPE